MFCIYMFCNQHSCILLFRQWCNCMHYISYFANPTKQPISIQSNATEKKLNKCICAGDKANSCWKLSPLLVLTQMWIVRTSWKCLSINNDCTAPHSIPNQLNFVVQCSVVWHSIIQIAVLQSVTESAAGGKVNCQGGGGEHFECEKVHISLLRDIL